MLKSKITQISIWNLLFFYPDRCSSLVITMQSNYWLVFCIVDSSDSQSLIYGGFMLTSSYFQVDFDVKWKIFFFLFSACGYKNRFNSIYITLGHCWRRRCFDLVILSWKTLSLFFTFYSRSFRLVEMKWTPPKVP